jgi:hypothetical protein
MPRATCRCGEILTFPERGPERIVCPRCSARIRVRRPRSPQVLGDEDGFVRFACPCGRRLKVRVEDEMPDSGRCPDCGRTVPVPEGAGAPPSSNEVLPSSHPEAPTVELDAADLDRLERWRESRQAAVARAVAPAPAPVATTAPFPAAPASAATPAVAPPTPTPAPTKVEAGLRVCPRCGKPVHLSSIVCRSCGAHVPKR